MRQIIQSQNRTKKGREKEPVASSEIKSPGKTDHMTTVVLIKMQKKLEEF